MSRFHFPVSFREPLARAMVAMFVLAIPVALVLGSDGFLLMLARSFMRQWVVVLGVVVLLFAWRRQWHEMVCALTAVLVVAFQVPWLPANVDHVVSDHAPMRVAQFNLLQPNRHQSGILAAVAEQGADVLSFQEVDHRWAAVLDSALADHYPYRMVVPRTDCYGIALFSRLPVDHFRVLDLLGAPAIRAEVVTSKGPVAVTSVHARSPLPYGAYLKRNRQLALLAAHIRADVLPQVVVGDLNAVDWDHALVRFRERSGLHQGPIYEAATFPSLFGWALIPIDHIYASDDLRVGPTVTGRLPGSDHKALIADVHWYVP